MSNGIARKIDDLGRIVIPAEMRRHFNIQEGDEIAIDVDGDRILLSKVDATCTFCGSTEQVSSFQGRGICTVCRDQLSRSSTA